MRYRRYKILHLSDGSIPVSPMDEEKKLGTMAKADNPKDWKFMEQSGEVLANIPDTWKAYPHDTQGMKGIVCMEYHEFKKAESEKEMSHELVHLASACLYLWRHINDAE